jgi:hypothetical protein
MLMAITLQRLYQRGGFFVTDFMLAFATFREAFGISSGVMVAILLFAKCFHWLLSDRIEAVSETIIRDLIITAYRSSNYHTLVQVNWSMRDSWLSYLYFGYST